MHRTILRDPGDMMIRLAFADRLRESDDPLLIERGTFIWNNIPPFTPDRFVFPLNNEWARLRPRMIPISMSGTQHQPGWVNPHWPDVFPIAVRGDRYRYPPNIWWENGFVSGIQFSHMDILGNESFIKQIFNSQPITHVRIINRDPDNRNGWSWTRGLSGTMECVATNIFDAMPDGDFAPHSRFEKRYSSRELAMNALSTGCVNWGRKLVGLPKLSRI